MIKIKFKQKNLNDFITYIEPPLKKEFNRVLRNKTKEEKIFLLYIRDVLTLKKVLFSPPNELNTKVTAKINKKIFFLTLKIDYTITPKNFNKYLKLLYKPELIEIIQKSSIRSRGKKTNEELIKCIFNHRFSKNEKIEFSKNYFKIRTKELLKEIFENFYSNVWDSKVKDYDRYCFVKSLDIKSCPYCNRNYIFIVEEDKIRPEIDHFYPKSKFPHLSMSFFNLIPSCRECNRTKWNYFEHNMVNPYEEIDKVNSINFKIDVKKINFFDLKSKIYDFDSFDISVSSSKNDNINIFKLDKLYQQHKDIVLDLLVKYKFFSPKHIKYLKSYGFSEDSIYRYFLNNYKNSDDFNKRPLSKLTSDISHQLKLIKKIEKY